jgi:hypothetical protein
MLPKESSQIRCLGVFGRVLSLARLAGGLDLPLVPSAVGLRGSPRIPREKVLPSLAAKVVLEAARAVRPQEKSPVSPAWPIFGRTPLKSAICSDVVRQDESMSGSSGTKFRLAVS